MAYIYLHGIEKTRIIINNYLLKDPTAECFSRKINILSYWQINISAIILTALLPHSRFKKYIVTCEKNLRHFRSSYVAAK